MIKNSKILQQFEDRYLLIHPHDPNKAIALIDVLWEEGMALGVLPPKDPMEGIDVDIRILRIVNCLKR